MSFDSEVHVALKPLKASKSSERNLTRRDLPEALMLPGLLVPQYLPVEENKDGSYPLS